MDSAFGIDHGEFSKAIKLSDLARPGTSYMAPGKYSGTGVTVHKPGPQPAPSNRLTGRQVKAVRASMRQGKHGKPGRGQGEVFKMKRQMFTATPPSGKAMLINIQNGHKKVLNAKPNPRRLHAKNTNKAATAL